MTADGYLKAAVDSAMIAASWGDRAVWELERALEAECLLYEDLKASYRFDRPIPHAFHVDYQLVPAEIRMQLERCEDIGRTLTQIRSVRSRARALANEFERKASDVRSLGL